MPKYGEEEESLRINEGFSVSKFLGSQFIAAGQLQENSEFGEGFKVERFVMTAQGVV